MKLGNKMKYLQTIAVIIGVIGSSLTQAASPVAIVEDVQAAKAGVEIMDFLQSGQKITLGKGESLTIGYMDSCKRERIKGGEITIGKTQSTVNNGQVIREDVECDGGQASLSGQVGAKSGALAFRSASSNGIGLQKPKINIYGSAPVIVLPVADQHIVIESLTGKPDRHELDVKGKYIDLADHNIELYPGQTYKVEANGISTTFRIVSPAEPGKAPLVSRLVRL
jgi:hypothetical protein